MHCKKALFGPINEIITNGVQRLIKRSRWNEVIKLQHLLGAPSP